MTEWPGYNILLPLLQPHLKAFQEGKIKEREIKKKQRGSDFGKERKRAGQFRGEEEEEKEEGWRESEGGREGMESVEFWELSVYVK